MAWIHFPKGLPRIHTVLYWGPAAGALIGLLAARSVRGLWLGTTIMATTLALTLFPVVHHYGVLKNLGNLMKQAQQMQDRMQKLQEEIANMEVTGESGAGLVKVTITGSHSVRRVEIDESLMEDDKEMLEDLIAAAFNDAARRVEETQKEKMASVTGGMQLPPGMKMPF